MKNLLKRIGLAATFVTAFGAQAQSDTQVKYSDPYFGAEPVPELTIRYLAFPSSAQGRRITVSGRLQMPLQEASSAPLPAVIIMHGTGGVSLRGSYYAIALNRAGIATLEVDQWGARGLSGGAEGRPKTVYETLPDVFGAQDLLANTKGIDARRIGVLGFSWGGVAAMLASTQRYQDEYGHPGGPLLAAAMSFYPVCWGYGRVPGYEVDTMRAIPLRIVAAGEDDYDEGAAPCETLVKQALPLEARAKASLKIYPGVGHAFDGFSPVSQHPDPYGHLGKGGLVTIGPAAPEARAAARADVVQFFAGSLK